MSQELLQERVGQVEKEQARQGEELRSIRTEVSTVGSDVKLLLERDAKRPDLSMGRVVATVGGTLSVLLGLGLLVGTLVENAPAVKELTRRMDQAEWKYGWAARVDR